MKIQYRHPATGESSTEEAVFTTEHSASSYGHPVLLADSGLFDQFNWQALDAKVIEATATERKHFAAWLE